MSQETMLIILMATGAALFISISLLVEMALFRIAKWRRK